MKFYRNGILFSLVEDRDLSGTFKDKYMLGGALFKI